MTPEEHREEHIRLHRALDSLLADFIFHTGKSPTKTTIMELAAWTYEQTLNPSEIVETIIKCQ